MKPTEARTLELLHLLSNYPPSLTWRSPKLIQVFLLFIGVLVGTVALCMTRMILDLVQVPVALHPVFLDGGSINAGCGSVVEGLPSLASFIQTKILFRELTQSLT